VKKVIGLLAGAAVIAAAALIFLTVVNNPEKQIIGKWVDANTNYGFTFAEDGTVTFPIEFFDLGFEADINGKYEVDKKDDEITFTFSFFSIDYSKTYDFDIKGDALTLTNDSSGKSTVFTKQK
jgi:hypothetical protein